MFKLNKCLLLLYSRREIDKIIKENRIKINSKIALIGERINLGDIIELDNKIINWEENIKNKEIKPNVS